MVSLVRLASSLIFNIDEEENQKVCDHHPKTNFCIGIYWEFYSKIGSYIFFLSMIIKNLTNLSKLNKENLVEEYLK